MVERISGLVAPLCPTPSPLGERRPMSSGVSPSPKAEVPPSSMGGSPALVGPLPGPSGTALINLAFATNPSNLVQGTGSLPMPPQVVPPQMTTITLTRDMRTEGQLNQAGQKPILVTVSGLPGIMAGPKPQGCADNCVQLTPISIAGPTGVVSLATAQTTEKILGCPGSSLAPVTTTAMLVGKPGSITVIPASQATFGTLFAAAPVTSVPASFGATVLATSPASSTSSATVVSDAVATATMAPMPTVVPTMVSAAAPMALVSSVPTPIPVVLPSSVTVASLQPPTSNVGGGGASSTMAGGTDVDPTQPDFDPIQAMEWKDGIASLPGSNLRFRLTEFGTLEVVADEGEPLQQQVQLQQVSEVKIAPKHSSESPLKSFVVPQYTVDSTKIEELPSKVPTSDVINEDTKPKRSDIIICCQFCNCHGLKSEFVRDGHFCSQLCYVNFASRERIKRKEEHFKQKKRKLTPNGDDTEEDGLEEEQSLPKGARRTTEERAPMAPVSQRIPERPKVQLFSWSEYLEKEKLTAAPTKLFKEHQAVPATHNGFRVGMKLEALDPHHQAMVCVVTVVEVVGFRLRLHFDGYPNNFDFWANADSADLFPAGWCERTDHRLHPPKGYTQQEFNWALYLKASKAQAAPKYIFPQRNAQLPVPPLGLRAGMKLEAVDKKDPSLVCVATVAEVSESGRFLVHFDGWDGSYDYWADPGSPWVHPIHWCKDHGHPLTAPSTYRGPFSWDKYLSECKAQAVPSRALRPRQIGQGWRKGLRLEAVDPRNPRLVRVVSVAQVQPRGLLLHMDGWDSSLDFFVDEDSPDIHPAGWCAKTGHPLEPPPSVQGNALLSSCPTPGCRGVGHIKGPKFAIHHSEFGCPYSKMNQEADVPDRLGGARTDITIDIVRVAQDSESGSTPTADTKDGLRKCPTPGCNGSGHLNQKYSVHHKASGCPLAERTTQGDESSQDSVQSSVPPQQAPRGRGRPRKNKIVPGPQKVASKPEVPAPGGSLHNCVHQSVFCSGSAAPTVVAPPPGPERSLCWEQHSKLLAQFDLVSGAVVASWSVTQVATFVCSLPGCQAVAKIFRDEQIDGEAFLLLTQADLVRMLKLKLGPALKIYSCILRFRSTCGE